MLIQIKLLNKQKYTKQNDNNNYQNMNNNFLQESQSTLPQGKGSFASYQLKIKHLNDLNKKMTIENNDLKSIIKNLQSQKLLFLNNHIDQNDIIDHLNLQLQAEKQKNKILYQKNQQLLATILLNEQMNAESKKQSNFYVTRYQQKILQLRQGLQLKQLQTQAIQDKYQKSKLLQLPMSVKNANRYTIQILKYETLIQQLVEQRNRDNLKHIEEINYMLPIFNIESDNKKALKKNKKQACSTDIRNNLNTLSSQPSNAHQDKLDSVFLRLHLQLRQLKKKYRQRLEQISEYKNKDKIMKQGYNTLTKQIQKVRVQNCQLKIQLEHLDKKFKTSKELSLKVKSVGNMPKRNKQQQNAQSKFSSQASIQCNLSQAKQFLKVNLPSQTKYDTLQITKSHNFDEQIENIEGILSLDSSPDFRNLKNRKDRNTNQQDEQQLSICEQNEVDLSISLNTSGFLAPQRTHHQISEHILRGLIDKKVF